MDLGATLNPVTYSSVFVTFLMALSSNKVTSLGTRAWDSNIPFGEGCFNSQLCLMRGLVWLFGYLTDSRKAAETEWWDRQNGGTDRTKRQTAWCKQGRETNIVEIQVPNCHAHTSPPCPLWSWSDAGLLPRTGPWDPSLLPLHPFLLPLGHAAVRSRPPFMSCDRCG